MHSQRSSVDMVCWPTCCWYAVIKQRRAETLPYRTFRSTITFLRCPWMSKNCAVSELRNRKVMCRLLRPHGAVGRDKNKEQEFLPWFAGPSPLFVMETYIK